ncbi:MAG TPA: hypothetical protein VM677_17665 [Actinokineospora sp.]|nr:hypothetical protein [Actinokineospora sp.]
MNTTTDTHWRDDLTLIGALSTVNRQLALYVLRLLDVDAQRAPELPITDESTLGRRMIELGQAIHARAARRQPPPYPPSDDGTGRARPLIS